jgi:processive 1,2-diacylglycerol beta-glucosyltransferase
MQGKGVLIVSASAGTGHLRAAEALACAFGDAAPGMRVSTVDLLQLAPRWVRAAYGPGYEALAVHAPRVWGEIYRWTDFGEHDRPAWAPLARRLLFREFQRLLREGGWSACVCTHFLPCQLAAGAPGLPSMSLVVTDFELHRVWLQPGAARAFVATAAMAAEYRMRLPRVPIHATGIPVLPRFAGAPPREQARRELGLDPTRPVLLVIGGGLGVGVEDAVRAALDSARDDVQVVAVCGRNDGARARLSTLDAPSSRLLVHGYVNSMERFMAAADLVATKPGGLSTSEALAVGRPLLLTTPIPGAEEGNLRALVAAGAAVPAPTADGLRQAFGRAFRQPGLLERLSGGAARLGRPDAAAAVARAVLADAAAARIAA